MALVPSSNGLVVGGGSSETEEAAKVFRGKGVGIPPLFL